VGGKSPIARDSLVFVGFAGILVPINLARAAVLLKNSPTATASMHGLISVNSQRAGSDWP